MSRAASLMETVRGLLERTYRMRSGLSDLAPFVIGDRGYRLLYRGWHEGHAAGGAAGCGAKTLVREVDDAVKVCVYYPDSMIRRLEAFPPHRGVGEVNVTEFATFVEEIDHLLFIAERWRAGRPVSLFELELHANVSKHLVVARFLAGRSGRLDADRRLWLRRHLFDGGRYGDPDPAVRARYRDAARYAVKLIDGLPVLERVERIAALRRFHAADPAEKLELIRRVAA